MFKNSLADTPNLAQVANRTEVYSSLRLSVGLPWRKYMSELMEWWWSGRRAPNTTRCVTGQLHGTVTELQEPPKKKLIYA